MQADLFESAVTHLTWQSERRRQLTPASELRVAPVHTKVEEALKKVKAAAIPFDATLTATMLTHLNNIVAAIAQLTANVNSSHERMLKNQTIFEEEIDILWWVFNEQSRDLGKPLSTIPAESACLVAAKELADLTRILPEHQTAAQFLSAALNKSQIDLTRDDEANVIRLTEAINSSPRQWREQWRSSFKEAMVPPNLTSLCPIIKGIELSLQTEGDEWIGFWKKATGLIEDFALQPLDLSLRVYRECLLLRAAQSK
jgi:hypothetical protein